MDPSASHMGEIKNLKNGNNVNKSILEVFDDLSHKSEVKRNNSCIALVQHLVDSVDDESVEDVPKNLSYCLKRLIRGLGGTRQPQQKGYFTALVSVLDTFPVITAQQFIETVDKELGGSKDAEEKESTMGVVLAYGAAIRGGLFARSSVEQQKQIISTLFKCGKKKSYIPYVSSTFVLNLIASSDECLLMKTIWPVLKDEVSKPWVDQSLDTLAILLLVSNRTNIVKNKTIQKWLGFSLFSPESMQHFSQKLVANSTSLTVKHPVYEEFCKNLCLPNNESLLQTFWTVHVDSLLATSNKNKDLAVLRILTILMKTMTNKLQIEVLVTPRVLGVIGRILRAPPAERKIFQELHTLAREAITTFGTALSTDDVTDKIRLSVLKKILFDSGNLQYEKQTGTHIAILLENKLTKKGVVKLAKQFKEVVDGTSQSNGKVWTNKDRKFAAQQLTRLIGHQACNNEIEWKVEQLLFLLHRGIFRQDSSSTIGVELAGTLRHCFFRALDQKFSNIDTMIGVLSKIVQHINDELIKQDAATQVVRIPFSNEASLAWKKMLKTSSQLERNNVANGNKESAERIFHALFLFMGLQLISDPDMAAGSLQELHSCYDRVKNGKKDSQQEEPQWVEVTIDLFLSLLSHDSHLLRTIVGTVFPYLSKHLSVSAFYQILEVLDPDQNENPLTSINEADDSDGQSSSDDEDNVNSSRQKALNGKSKHLKKASEGTSDEESDDESESNEDSDNSDEENDVDEEGFEDFDDEEDMDETINDKLRQEVRYALGNAASLTDTESVDLDDIDEEEGQRMDKALAEAFKNLRQSRSSKKSKKQLKSEEAVTHFRNRVLDLVEIYISREPSMDICLECITPLLSLLAFSMKDVHQKPLEMKTKSILHKLTSLKRFSSIGGANEKSLADLIKSLAGKGVRSATTFLGLADVISDCCSFLVRCSEFIRSQPANQHKPAKSYLVANVIESLFVDFCTKRDTLLPINMFKSVINLQWSGCWSFVPVIIQHAFDSKVRPFRRGQAIELLSTFFRNNHLLNSADEKQKQALKKIVSSIINNTIDLLRSDNDTTGRVQPRHNHHLLASVLKLIKQILTRSDTKPASTSNLSSALDSFCQNCGGVPAETRKVLTSLSKQLSFDISSLKKKMKKVMAESAVILSGDSNDEESEDENDSKNPILNRTAEGSNGGILKKQVLPKGKSRKDKKIHRMALMGKGLDSVTFSSVNDSMLNGREPDDDTYANNSFSKFNGSKSEEMSPLKRKLVSSNSQVPMKKKRNV
ncbi:Myb-binding protein 1A [Frankliniella fusca]|uniref:Myb-binding protein 1A n=1 Tax=Frankliniella fusca TaxID=407009 RepID=A0AAE1L5F1_9NEOP|nr:Myb-binding protein 1A [Frankliniella fusca]